MRHTLALSVIGVLTMAAASRGASTSDGSFYSLNTTTLDGHPVNLSRYSGKVALVVNVASQCGFTPQYAGLQKLYDELKDRGFVVLGFPSNDFGGQEPGSPDEIAGFCKKNYGVTFPMFSKLVTRAGTDQSPIYAYLGQGGSLPKWNFGKYLVGRDGHVIQYFESKVAPDAPELREAIEKALAVKDADASGSLSRKP